MTEIDRLCQVEEEWGRRGAMEPISNAERLALYESRKALWRCFPVDVGMLPVSEVRAACVLPFPLRGQS